MFTSDAKPHSNDSGTRQIRSDLVNQVDGYATSHFKRSENSHFVPSFRSQPEGRTGLWTLGWYYAATAGILFGIIFTFVATRGVVSSAPNSDTDGYEQISLLQIRRWPIREITICCCPLPRDGCCVLTMSLVNVWCLIIKMLTLWQFGHFLNHHGVVLELDGKGTQFLVWTRHALSSRNVPLITN